MLRRGFFAILVGLGMMAPVGASAQALFRTVVEVNSGDPAQMERALNMVLEMGRYHIAYKESAEIRVIAVGEGMTMLRTDTSPVLKRLTSVARSLPIVRWYTGLEDVAEATAAEGAPPPLYPGVAMVQGGRGEAARLEAEGWSLIRP